MMAIKNNLDFGNMTDEQIASIEAMGLMAPSVIPEISPEEETVEEVKIEIIGGDGETKTVAPKFVFKAEDIFESNEEEFELNELEKEMRTVLQVNSKEMARARLFISGEDENGLPFGNFNGAGGRAITMYQPEHPEAGTGRNYGKVFYRWTNPKVVELMHAIFEECGWDPAELLEQDEEVEETQEE